MRGLLYLLPVLALGQIPEKDARLTGTEATKFDFAMPKYATKAEWELRKTHLQKQILAAAGLLPMPPRPAVRAQIFGKMEREGYSIEKVYIETLPGYYLCGNLYRPLGKTGKFPGVLSPHGHWKHGRLEHTDLASVPGRSINLARQGYVVFAYDMVGYNDTKQTPHVFGEDREHLYNFNPFALQTWNSVRALDFLESLPDVDPTRLAATGASGGGTQTFILAAIDPRLAADVPVNMISGIMQGGSPCENAPGLRHDTMNVDIGAMMAPRPMLMVAATGDWTKNTPKNEYPAIKGIYTLYDAASQVESIQFDSPHNYHQRSREAMYTFFSKHLMHLDSGSVAEQPFTVEKTEDMLVWNGRDMPANAVELEGVFEQWRTAFTVREPDREALRYALSVENPVKVLSSTEGEKIVLSRAGKNDRIAGLFHSGTGKPILIVHPGGAQDAKKAEPATERPALYIDTWMTGDASLNYRDTSATHFYTFHRTDAQNRVQDILTAIAWLHQQYDGPVEIRSFGMASVWATYATAVSSVPVELNSEAPQFNGTDQEFAKKFFVPGIQRVGGWKAALALTAENRRTQK